MNAITVSLAPVGSVQEMAHPVSDEDWEWATHSFLIGDEYDTPEQLGRATEIVADIVKEKHGPDVPFRIRYRDATMPPLTRTYPGLSRFRTYEYLVSLAPVGEGTGDSSLSGANSPALVEHCSEGGDSFSLIHNPRAHVCPACNTGYVRKPDHCHACDYPLWFDSKREARKILESADV